MGRPRKRQFVEVAETEKSIPLEDAAAPYPVTNLQAYNDSGNLDPVFMDSLIQAAEPYIHGNVESAINADWNNMRDVRSRWQFGNFEKTLVGPPIDFNNNNMDNNRLLHSGLDRSASEVGSSPAPSGPCSCLASMYLALSSLQTLPVDSVDALRVVRGAAQTAAMTIWCPQCGSVVVDTPDPPMESFQNTMLLGTLLPLIANAYRQVLKMVDHEAEVANALHQPKLFRFQEYGGLCGAQVCLRVPPLA